MTKCLFCENFQAAIARFQQQERQPKRPQSATATWKSHSNEPASKSNVDTGVNVSKIRNEGDNQVQNSNHFPPDLCNCLHIQQSVSVPANIFQEGVGNLPNCHKNCPTYSAIDSCNFVPIKLRSIHAQLYHVIF